MKRFYLTGLAILATIFAFSQNILPEKRIVNASYQAVIEPMKHHPNLTKNAVLTQDFEEETFPPTGWDTICGPESLGKQHWYRQTGLRPDNGTYYAIIQRKSTLEDSDTITRPQNEWLISPTFSVPQNAILKFYFHSNPYWTVGATADGYPFDNADINLMISTDDGNNWTNIWNEDDFYYSIGWPFSQWTEVVLDISNYAGQENVKIAFQYVGRAACWFAIDNISVDILPTIDFELTDACITFNPEYANYGYGGFISTFPKNDIGGDSTTYNLLGGVVTNYGHNDIVVKMTTKVFNPNNQEIFSFSYDNDTIPAGQFINGCFSFVKDTIYSYAPVTDSTFRIIPGSAFMMDRMTETGIYRYEISIEPVGFEYTNTSGRTLSYSAQTNITEDCIFERGIEPTSSMELSDTYTGAGTPFILRNPNDLLMNIGAYITSAETGAIFKYTIYDKNLANIITETDPYIVEDDFTSGYVILSAEDPVTLEELGLTEGYYIPVIVTVEVTNGKNVSIGTDNNVNGYAAFYAKASDGWHQYADKESYMIRLYTCDDIEEPYVESFDANEIEMFPNPTTGIVNFNNVENATIEVFNMMGQVVSRVENASENATMDLSTVANGNYVVRIVKDGEVSTSKLSIAR